MDDPGGQKKSASGSDAVNQESPTLAFGTGQNRIYVFRIEEEQCFLSALTEAAWQVWYKAIPNPLKTPGFERACARARTMAGFRRVGSRAAGRSNNSTTRDRSWSVGQTVAFTSAFVLTSQLASCYRNTSSGIGAPREASRKQKIEEIPRSLGRNNDFLTARSARSADKISLPRGESRCST